VLAIKGALIDSPDTDAAGFQNKALILAGLDLEQETLNTLLDKTTIRLNTTQSELSRVCGSIADIERDNKRAELVARFKELKATGTNERAIRSELGLNSREFDNLKARC